MKINKSEQVGIKTKISKALTSKNKKKITTLYPMGKIYDSLNIK